MRSHSSLLVVLLTLLIVGSGVSGADTRHVATDSLDAPASVDGAVASQSAVNETANGTTIRITPQPDGDARWNVSMEFVAQNENETAAFKELGDDFKNGDDTIGPSEDVFIRIVQQMEAETGRDMKILDPERKYTSSNTTHTLSLTFVWTNFTRVEGDRIILRDAFLLDDGESTWLGSLAADQRLIIEEPPGYRIQNSPNFGHSNGTIMLEGPKSLNSENKEIDVTYTKIDGGTIPIISTTNIVLLLLVVSTGAVGVYVLMQRRDNKSADDPADAPPAPSPESEHDSEPEHGSESESDELDVELLSDEERVEHLLKQNGGRMKQAKIVTETNWSNAKVSQLLSSMDKDDRVDKLRIGRENLITLPDEDIADFDNE
ncbi:helix-turn-helix transcriptional regulator [Haladaptatus sp. DFWS20]|uniref:helix-turn-helix transcriptional regulator n=1 Tax=Haladaptatus sp. DFWS20 TaxID=3403467 RepID=UPI003EBFF63D